jgi:hypothetical protein
MVYHFAGCQGLAHSDLLSPGLQEDDNDDSADLESESRTTVEAPTPKSEAGRKRSVIDRFGAVAVVGTDIKDGFLGLGNIISETLSKK